MVTTDTAIDALSAALALARAEGREVRGMKSLLCDACGEGVALRAGGFCHRCADEMMVVYTVRAEEDAAAMVDALDTDGFAASCAAAYGDDEAAAILAGIETAKF